VAIEADTAGVDVACAWMGFVVSSAAPLAIASEPSKARDRWPSWVGRVMRVLSTAS